MAIQNRVKKNSVLFATLATTLLASLAIEFIQADQAHAVNSTLSMSIDDATLNLDISPRSANGDFAKSANSTISVTTNNFSGYTLSITASNSTSLLNTADSNKAITSISSAVSESDFSADSTTAAANYNGKWGYKPEKYNSVANSNFLPSPGTDNNGHVLDTTSVANATTPNTYTISIGARVDSTTAPGTYSNTFVISAVANIINYSITYDKGATSDTVSNLPSDTTGVISDPITGSTDVTLTSATPTRADYNFIGWCTVVPMAGTGLNPDTCSGTTIQPAGTYSFNATTSPNVTVYALWEKQIRLLYDKVAVMSKGTQNLDQLRSAITVPTSADRTQDTSNSGVYEYNSSVFGAANDAANTHAIYYYRGVLENSVGSYGSDGSAITYPNYVILDSNSTKDTSDTCWRIVRTTGSGGIKMIYNGKWTGTTCANATDNTLATNALEYDITANSEAKSIVGMGYTYDARYKSTTSSTVYTTLFGSNTNYSGNTTDSTMKAYLENTWFPSIARYESGLEPSAGYCNDRSIRTGNSSTSVISDSTSITTPYTTGTSTTAYYFGAYVRNATTSDKPTLGCPRSGADLYTTSSASNGNKQLSRPIALLTADESAFAGSGEFRNTTPYHKNSFLNSGSLFWLLSPYERIARGSIIGISVGSDGDLVFYSVNYSHGVRPVISLKPGTEVASGSGTATDPWVVNPPSMQDFTASMCQQQASSAPLTLTDSRDSNQYTVRYINGACWMTQNLRITNTTGQPAGTILSEGSDFASGTVTMTNGTAFTNYETAQYHVPTTADITANGNTFPAEQVGAWYSFCAASAQSGTGACANATYSGNESICPAGWHLPTTAQFNDIVNNSANFNLIYGGYYDTNELLTPTTFGSWLSATPNSAGYQDSLQYSNGSLKVSGAGKRRGRYIRCVRTE